MSDLIDDDGGAAEGGNVPAFSVSELSGAIKRVVEAEFGFVRVRGEIGRVSRPRSGHVYLDLKDDRAVLAAVIWKGVAQGLRPQPEEGMEVVATGRLTTFAGQSRYQLVIEHLAPAGVGALMAMLEKRRQALAAEGLFAAERKRPLPFLPEVIGVVTSPSGAVIRDILHRLADRFPRTVLIWPVAVQGERSAGEVAAAIRGFDAIPPDGPVPRPDLLIVARGGGSIEDLWGFNEEIVVRAAAESAIPLISAVGHETDTTLIDHAADQRAPTPTAAAEMAVPVRAELLATLAALEERRRRALSRQLEVSGRRLRDLARVLPRPDMLLAERVQILDGLALRLPRALAAHAQAQRARLGSGAGGRFGPALLRALLRERQRRVADLAVVLPRALSRRLAEAREGTRRAAQRLRPERVLRGLELDQRRLAEADRRLNRSAQASLGAARRQLASQRRLLDGLSYRGTLARGFAVVREPGAAVVSSQAEAATRTALEIEFSDGRLTVAVTGDAPKPPAPQAAPKRRRRKSDEDQGSLF
ncbi:MAG: exodeoxyribonuclease VII large subunit [Pseudomonadota bacterium]